MINIAAQNKEILLFCAALFVIRKVKKIGQLRLDNDEAILLQAVDVEKIETHDSIEIEDLYLTNKNIIMKYRRTTGLFSYEEIIDIISIDTIRIDSGVVQVQIVKDVDYCKYR